jgi:quercetin dioxygenase-like cupin family protein
MAELLMAEQKNAVPKVSWSLSGQGQYQIEAMAASIPIGPGDVVVAHRGEVHGVYNNGSEALVFVSVVAPAASGFEPL